MNFEEQEGRQDYLNNKLDDLLEGINASYGQSLLNELVRRLNRTIEDFNEEFQGIIGDLKDNSERRHQILHDLMEGKLLETKKVSSGSQNAETGSIQQEDSDSDSEEMSAWEKRLEGLE
tara:strand:- start:59 stop:415 length:357 start_codon:yes stop_codon:yes gene_type:complete